MKTSLLTTILFFALCTASVAQKLNDKDAIKKVIDQETKSYFLMQYDQWASTWVHDSTAFRINITPSSFSKYKGWDTLNEGMEASMKGATPYTEDEMAPYINKYNYEYYINGNSATVFLKEGKSNEDANDEIRLMAKQNGEWKIVGLTIIHTSDYALKNSLNKLSKFIGKWKIVDGSYKTTPADTGLKFISFSADIHEMMNGIEITSSVQDNYAGTLYLTNEIEQFILDNDLNKFRYFDNGKTSEGTSFSSVGTAEFDSSGRFVMSSLYNDKPVVRLKNYYTLNPDGSVLFEGENYSRDGEKTYSWSFDLKRM